MDIENELIVTAPIFLLTASHNCSLCGAESLVATIATLNLSDPNDEDYVPKIDGEGFMLSYIRSLPDEVLAIILERHPNYNFEFSLTAGENYYMSICECGGHYGDYYVHEKIAELAFLAPESLGVQHLQFDGCFSALCDFTSSQSVGALLQKYQYLK